jgi:hypothetical protein
MGLPASVTLSAATGAFGGVPEAVGTYRVLIAAANVHGLGVAEMVVTVLPQQPPVVSYAFVDVGMVSAAIYSNNGVSPLLGGSFGLGYFGSAYDFASKTRDQILADITWMDGSVIQGNLIDAANPGQFYLSGLQSLAPTGARYYAFLSTGATTAGGNWLVVSGAEAGGWYAQDPNGLSVTTIDLGFLGNTILAGTPGWRFASGGLTSLGDENIVLSLSSDTTPPSIALLGANPVTVYRGGSFADSGATVTDNVDVARTIYGSGTVDTSKVGSYTLTYAAQDAAGNAATAVTRTVNVVLNPSGDEDSDGVTNYREQADDTDPYDAASFDALSKGLVAYYPFDGSANDASGFQETATLSVNATYVPRGAGLKQALRIVGKGWFFRENIAEIPSLDKSNAGEFVEIPEPALNDRGVFTASIWVNEEGMSNEAGEAYITAGYAGESLALVGNYHL